MNSVAPLLILVSVNLINFGIAELTGWSQTELTLSAVLFFTIAIWWKVAS
jgi:hypothetical protein